MAENWRPDYVKTAVDLSEDHMPGSEPIDEVPQQHAREEEDRLIGQFRDRMFEGWRYWSTSYDLARADIHFAYNEQWEEEVRREREDRPCLSLNILPNLIKQVVGRARQSKFSIKIIKKGGVNAQVPLADDPQRMLSYQEIMSGIVRDIEQRSKASMAYARALQHAVEGGFGWLHVRTVRPPDDPRNIDIVIEHVKDRWSVMFDPLALKPDLTDAKWAAMTVLMGKKEYDARYPDQPIGPAEWLTAYEDSFRDWWSLDKTVRVTDYYFKQPVKRKVVTWIHPRTREDVWGYDDELKQYEDELKAEGFERVSTKELEVNQLMWMRTSGERILEGPAEYPCELIPIVPVFGRQIDTPSGSSYLSITRYAKDAVRMLNLWASASTERVANSPKAPIIVADEQVAGYEAEWRESNLQNRMALVYKHVDGMPPPSRLGAADPPGAELQLVELGRQAVMETTGVTEAMQGQRSNETSGQAILNRRQATEIGFTEYMDNAAHAVSVVGDILCQMIPRVYTDDRLQNLMMPDDSTAQVHLNHPITLTGEDGEKKGKWTLGALRLARYYCHAVPGAAVASEREALLEMMLEWGKNDPQSLIFMRDIILENMDAPGAKQIAQRAKMMVPRHLLSPQEQQSMPPAQPSPEQQAEMAKSQAEMAKSQSAAQVAEINTVGAQQKSELELEHMDAKHQLDMEILQVNLRIAEVKLREAQVEAETKAKEDRDDRTERKVRQEMAKSRAKGSQAKTGS